jgi:hypothetical protein
MSTPTPSLSRKSSGSKSFMAFVAAFAYAAGVFTGAISNQSMIATISDATHGCFSPGSLSAGGGKGDSSKLKAENVELKEMQQQLKLQVSRLQQQIQNMNKTAISMIPTAYKNTDNEKLRQAQLERQHLQDKVAELKLQVDAAEKAAEHDTKPTQPFPTTMEKFLVDYASIPRDDFNQAMDIGLPYDETNRGASEVLLLYTSTGARPSIPKEGSKFGLNATQAMENCNVVKVMLQQRHDHRRPGVKQCIAIVPNWDSFYVHNFMRLPKQKSRIDIPGEQMLSPGESVKLHYPLRYVSRSHEDDGSYFEGVPLTDQHTKPHYKALAQYYQSFDRVLKEVKSAIKTNVTFYKDVGETSNDKRTLVVMTVNKGQSILFHNFVCYSRKRGIDLKNILMFATDEYSYNLSHELGIPAFYDEAIFGTMPEKAASEYGDKVFSKMMLAKVICVHLSLYSGYNVLFQDVDVLWFKNPLPFLHSPELEEWDMVFQDDGSRQPRFRPYSANSGFYFVRNNAITRFFFSALLRMGDVMTNDGSHQTVLVSLINEFASWKGMRVKVFTNGADNPFPGGVEYHRDWARDLFYRMFEDNVYPYIFHMSWTFNMDDKLHHYQQMGMWYLGNDTSTCSGFDCCLDEPNFQCHKQDKPSMRPCPDAPMADGHRGKPFWPRPKQ